MFALQATTVEAAETKPKPKAKRPLPPRDEQIKSLQTESFDVLIIGGGATGAGCALDSVTRGKLFFYFNEYHYC